MNEQHGLLHYPRERADFVAGVIVVVGLGLVLVGPLTVGIGLYFFRQLTRPYRTLRSYAILIASVALAAIYAYFVLLHLVELYSNFVQGVIARGTLATSFSDYLLPAWVLSVPLAPAVTLAAEVVVMLRPKTVDEESELREQRIQEGRRKLSLSAGQQAQQGTEEKLLQLGIMQKGDYFERGLHNLYVHNGMLTFEREIFNQHCLVIGSSGAGKTWSLYRIIWELLSKTQVDVYFVDGKGEGETAEIFRAMAYKTRGEVPVFRLGHNKSGALYNGFKGSKMAIYERLGAMINLGDERNDPHWDATMDELLQLMCGINDSEIEPPRSFEEVLERLSTSWLEEAYAANLYELDVLSDYDKKDMQGFMRRLRSNIRVLIEVTSKDGFALEDYPAAIFSIRTMSHKRTGEKFLRFLVEDLTDFIGNRQQRPGVMIIDEFGAFGNDNIIKVLTMARSAELGVILSTQNIASLGDESTQKLITGNTGTQVLMRSNDPEEIVNLAGTVMRPEVTTHYEDGQVGSHGGIRMQHQYKIDNNEVRSLDKGEGFIIRIGNRAKLKFAEITKGEWKEIGTPPPEVIWSKQSNKSVEPESTKAEAQSQQKPKQPRRRHPDPDLLP